MEAAAAGGRAGAVRLAPRLVLVSLVTLLLPWAGCQTMRDVERALRAGQADALAAATTAVAGLVGARPERFLIDPDRFAADRTPSADVYAHPLPRPPVMDGFGDDWGLPESAWIRHRPPAGPALRYAAGEARGFIYLALDVEDDEVRYGAPEAADALLLRLGDPAIGSRDLVLSPEAPGPLRPPPGSGDDAARVEANWQPTSRGYSVELRVPLTLTVDRLGFLVLDRDGGESVAAAGSLADTESDPGWLVWRRQNIDGALAGAAGPGVRLRLLDPAGYVLADGGPGPSLGSGPADGPLGRLLRWMLGDRRPAATPPDSRPGWVDVGALAGLEPETTRVFRLRSATAGRVTLLAARPLPVTPGHQGVLIAEQDADAIVSLTDRAALRLFGASFLVGLLAAVLLLGFALWLSLRIRRLSAAAQEGLARREAPVSLPESDSRDELGDLARSFARLLGQLDEYNRYLAGLGSKLTHELRTPMTVVSTSLENLGQEPTGPGAARYLERARQGIARLQQMVTALGAATRMEEAIAAAETRSFDLTQLVAELGAAYASTATAPPIEWRVPDAPCPVTGSPELIAQACDKLVENARDFCPPDGRITLALSREATRATISVANTGSRLPDDGRADGLFDSLVSHRPAAGGDVHLGLGLYLVRLIAEHHGGRAGARNLPGGDGVIVELSLPRAA